MPSRNASLTPATRRESLVRHEGNEMNAESKKPLLIGQIAKLAGVKSDTVRFYERTGLLARPTRTAAGHRVYSEAAARQLRFIKKAQGLGFSLDEVRRILSLRGGGKKTCDRVLAIAEATLDETERRLTELQKFRDDLKRTSRRGKSQASALVQENSAR